MRESLKGGFLPESEEDFMHLRLAGRLRKTCCMDCKLDFSSSNTHTSAGWAETQISGMCEDCFDALFPDEDD